MTCMKHIQRNLKQTGIKMMYMKLSKIKSRLKNNYNIIIVKCNYMHSHEDDFEFIIITR